MSSKSFVITQRSISKISSHAPGCEYLCWQESYLYPVKNYNLLELSHDYSNSKHLKVTRFSLILWDVHLFLFFISWLIRRQNVKCCLRPAST